MWAKYPGYVQRKGGSPRFGVCLHLARTLFKSGRTANRSERITFRTHFLSPGVDRRRLVFRLLLSHPSPPPPPSVWSAACVCVCVSCSPPMASHLVNARAFSQPILAPRFSLSVNVRPCVAKCCGPKFLLDFQLNTQLLHHLRGNSSFLAPFHSANHPPSLSSFSLSTDCCP